MPDRYYGRLFDKSATADFGREAARPPSDPSAARTKNRPKPVFAIPPVPPKSFADNVIGRIVVRGVRRGGDTVPLASPTGKNQIARIIGDVSWLAYRWNKPLGTRLMLSPGQSAGEKTAFTAPGFVNTRLH